MHPVSTGRRERGPRGSPGTGLGGGAHREPVVKVGSAPGARPGGFTLADVFPNISREVKSVK